MKHRTIWISDLHLGTRGASVQRLLKWLRDNDAETIYLVGDIIDGWALARNWYWPQTHNDVIQKLLRKARHGTRVIYIPGNHDEFLRSFLDHSFGDVELVDEKVHETADGRLLLVIHGDQYDEVAKHAKWIAHLGDKGYDFLLWLNRWNGWLRTRLGWKPWSLSQAVKYKVKQAVTFISGYREALSNECKRRHLDGIVCGHIHHAEIDQRETMTYYNTGDWVESCTALVEGFDGVIRLVQG